MSPSFLLVLLAFLNFYPASSNFTPFEVVFLRRKIPTVIPIDVTLLADEFGAMFNISQYDVDAEANDVPCIPNDSIYRNIGPSAALAPQHPVVYLLPLPRSSCISITVKNLSQSLNNIIGNVSKPPLLYLLVESASKDYSGSIFFDAISDACDTLNLPMPINLNIINDEKQKIVEDPDVNASTYAMSIVADAVVADISELSEEMET